MPTATGFPTSTANPTGVILTGTAAFLTGTPTVTVTPTLNGPTATATLAGGTATLDDPLTGFLGLAGNTWANYNASTYSCVPVEGTSGIKTAVCTVNFSGTDTHTGAAANASFSLYMKLAPTTTMWRWSFVEISSPVGVTVQFKRSSTSGPLISATGQSGPGVQEAIVVQLNGINAFVGSTSYSVRMTLSTEPIPAELPTPTATASPSPVPTSSSYCSVVDASADESGFGLPVITGGTPVCGGAGGFIIPFSWFQLIGIELDDLIVPFIDVCFVPTSFGVLTIAGNTIDLDVAAYILGALFLLSLVL